ncbi:MAG TPA: hypothetical protein VMG10_26890 [Gemmataceae bacterium]|nr:hypothetical protein [Gemmataceae bacterium]
MHWEILIIPLIALGVWILSTVFKTGEDDKMKKGIRRPGGVPGRGSARRPVTDLDRFLEDARRRREAEERPWLPSSAPAPARPTRPPQRPAPPREMPRAAVPVVRRADVPIAAPVVPVVAAVPTREASPPPPAPPKPRETPPSPILKQVRSLLSKPQTAGAAFVLREIFDRPLSMRRR